ncbi:retrovirus-related pol polyprotein from transposon TNT 1-94 [Tanacetum coccineum]
MVWYMTTVEDCLPVAKKPIPKVTFKSPIPNKGCVLGLANVETWDNIVKKYRMRTHKRCANKSKGKRKEKSARGKMARSKNVYHHKMGRGGYVFVKEKMIENKEIEADEEPPRGIMCLKGKVNKDGEFTDDEIRSVGDKLKEVDNKIKEGTLNLDDGTDVMTVVFGKEKGGYARGVGSGVTYKRYFHFPRSRQVTDERIELLQTQLDNERREHQQKDELVKKLWFFFPEVLKMINYTCSF